MFYLNNYKTGKIMKTVSVKIDNMDLVYDTALEIARILAEKDNDLAMLISWYDKKEGKHSPAAVHCEINGAPGWEVYGENHEGRIKIIINEREYVFIYS
jgi:hypothetical protein